MSGDHHRHLYVERQSPIHDLAPEAKLVGLVAFVFAMASTGTFALPIYLAGGLLVVTAAAVSRLTPGQVLVRMLPAAPFLVLAALIPVISASSDANSSAANLAAKVVLGAVASIVFAATTRPTELVQALQRLRAPALIVSIVSFMFRYLDVMVAEVARIRTAMISRGYDPRWLKQAGPIASAGGVMFVRSFERGERVHGAMLARGFNGVIPATRSQTPATLSVWALAAMPALVVVVLRITT